MINDVSTRFGRSSGRCSPHRGFTLVELLVVVILILLLVSILMPAVRKSVEAGRQVACLDHLRQIVQATLTYCADNEGTFPSGAAIGVTGSDLPRPSDWVFWKTGYPAPYDNTARSAVGRYIGATAPLVFRCPSDTTDVRPMPSYSQWTYPYSYSINAWIGQNQTIYSLYWHHWCRTQDVVNPSQIILFVDEDIQSIDDGSWLPTLNSLHNEISNRHDTNRDANASGTAVYEPTTRGNVVFCDGHGDFVQRQFARAAISPGGSQTHYQPTDRPMPAGY